MFLEDKREVVPATLEPWQEALLQAADLLELDGWCQDFLVAPYGRCALGALAATIGNTGDASLRNLERSVGNVADWNDAPGRTADEVIARMRAVALAGKPWRGKWGNRGNR